MCGIVIPILQKRKRRLREVKGLVEGCSAGSWEPGSGPRSVRHGPGDVPSTQFLQLGFPPPSIKKQWTSPLSSFASLLPPVDTVFPALPLSAWVPYIAASALPFQVDIGPVFDPEHPSLGRPSPSAPALPQA